MCHLTSGVLAGCAQFTFYKRLSTMVLPRTVICSPESPCDGKYIVYSEADKDVSRSSSNL